MKKPPLGTLAHHRYIGIPESRLDALCLPSRVGNTLTYPAAHYEREREKAANEAKQKTAA